MFELTGPRLLCMLLVLLYAVFLFWFDHRGKALTPDEIDRYITRISAQAQRVGITPDPHLLGELRTLASSDDGGEFYMLNLINYHAIAQYPAGSPYRGTGLEADAVYNRAIAPYLFKHGNVPVFLATPMGRFIDVEGDTQWQRVAVVRYRSRRDLLEMVLDLAAKPIGIHKWASIKKTQVFPMKSIFSFVMVRTALALLMAAVGLGLHLLLRLLPFYAGLGQ